MITSFDEFVDMKGKINELERQAKIKDSIISELRDELSRAMSAVKNYADREAKLIETMVDLKQQLLTKALLTEEEKIRVCTA